MTRLFAAVAGMILAVSLFSGGTAQAYHGTPAFQTAYREAYIDCLRQTGEARQACTQELTCMMNAAIRSHWSEQQWAQYLAFIAAAGFHDPCLDVQAP